MKFSSPIVVLAAVSGAYSFAVPRDLKSITGVLTSVQADIDSLDKAIQGLATDPTDILEASNKLITGLRSGAQTVRGSESLGLGDAVKLLKPVGELKQHAQTLVNDLQGKKAKIQTLGLCDTVRSQVGTIGTGSKDLIDATVSKVPKITERIAQEQAKGITDVLNEAKEAFSEKNCVKA